ncbi:MAG: hypothetical protein IJO93_06405 [Clostridia bacterium]|nr:hypothetical protein [Clostridia bacterium]
MEDNIAVKLIHFGVLAEYNGFNYMCWILKKYNSYNVSEFTMNALTSELSEAFSVSRKAVLHNLTLLLERSWNSKDSLLHDIFNVYDYMPTLKEFIATLIILEEYEI